MFRIERTLTIHRPVDEVFAYLSDVAHGPAYICGQREAHTTSAGPMGVGTTFTTRSVVRRTRTYQVTAYEPSRALSWKTTSGRPKPPCGPWSRQAQAPGSS
jgi:uncharacterized protein YndB with AHSA1/START domain